MAIFPIHVAEILGPTGTTADVGMLFAAAALVGFAGAPVGGYLADKFGRKSTIVPAAALIAASATLVAMPSLDTYDTLLPAVMLWGPRVLHPLRFFKLEVTAGIGFIALVSALMTPSSILSGDSFYADMRMFNEIP